VNYAHYWRRSPELDRAAFTNAVEDTKLIFAKAKELGIHLAGPIGQGHPDATDFAIAFNGSKECGHRYMDLGKPWPSKTAEGVEATPTPISGPWFSGAMLETRVCGGCCAGGSFIVDRNFLVRPWDQLEQGRYFSYCETDFKPYDLIVTAILIRLKERLGDQIVISSDGLERGFEDAKKLCRELFGWASRFELEPQESALV
jgi:hypothetical protein